MELVSDNRYTVEGACGYFLMSTMSRGWSLLRDGDGWTVLVLGVHEGNEDVEDVGIVCLGEGGV